MFFFFFSSFFSLGQPKFQQLSSPPWAFLSLFLLPLSLPLPPSSHSSFIFLSSLSSDRFRCAVRSSRVLASLSLSLSLCQDVLDSSCRALFAHHPPLPHLWVPCVGGRGRRCFWLYIFRGDEKEGFLGCNALRCAWVHVEIPYLFQNVCLVVILYILYNCILCVIK